MWTVNIIFFFFLKDSEQKNFFLLKQDLNKLKSTYKSQNMFIEKCVNAGTSSYKIVETEGTGTWMVAYLVSFCDYCVNVLLLVLSFKPEKQTKLQGYNPSQCCR